MTNRPAWLWADSSSQVYLSTGRALYGPATLKKLEANHSIHADTSIHAVLPTELAIPFTQLEWDTLILDSSLPEVWQRFDWEALHISGKALSDFCSVTRLAKSEGPMNVKCSGLLLVTALAQNDPVQSAITQLLSSVRDGISHWGTPKKPERIGQEWRTERDLAAKFSDLIIFAHGGENETDLVLDANGSPWLGSSTPMPRLPARVWLFVCSDKNGNLTPLVKQMLDNGAQQVLYGHGKLEAHRMVEVFTAWLEGGRGAMTSSMVGTLCNNTLRLAGSVPMHQPDLLTLAQDKELERDPVKRMKTSPLDLDSFKRQLAENRHIAQHCWPRTQNWLLPYLIYLAEVQQEQSARLEFDGLWNALGPDVRKISPATARYLATSAHRDGRYAQQIKYLDQVLELCSDQSDLQGFAFDAFLSMANLLIDMNLPKQNAKFIRKLDGLLDELPAIEVAEQKIKLHDVKARQAIRNGDGARAMDLYAKREVLESHQPTWGPKNAARVQAAALYAAAWTKHLSADKWAQQSLETLSLIPIKDRPYLCRALALYCWRCADGTHRAQAESACLTWLEFEFHTNHCKDFGPPAITTAALLLSTLSAAQREQLATEWKVGLREGLEEQRYWFELASWSAFLGDQDTAQDALNRFHEQRQGVFKEIGKMISLQLALGCTDLNSEIESREKEEISLLTNPELSMQHWFSQGCIPL